MRVTWTCILLLSWVVVLRSGAAAAGSVQPTGASLLDSVHRRLHRDIKAAGRSRCWYTLDPQPDAPHLHTGTWTHHSNISSHRYLNVPQLHSRFSVSTNCTSDVLVVLLTSACSRITGSCSNCRCSITTCFSVPNALLTFCVCTSNICSSI